MATQGKNKKSTPKVTVTFKQGSANKATRQAMKATEFVIESQMKSWETRKLGIELRHDFNVVFDDKPRGSKQALPSALVPTNIGGGNVQNINLDQSHPDFVESRKAFNAKSGKVSDEQYRRIIASIVAPMVISTVPVKERYNTASVVSETSNKALKKIDVKIARKTIKGKRVVTMSLLKEFEVSKEEKSAVDSILALPISATLKVATIPETVRTKVKVVCFLDCDALDGMSLATDKVTTYDPTKGNAREPHTWEPKNVAHPNFHILQEALSPCRTCQADNRTGQWQLLESYDRKIALGKEVIQEATEIVTATS